MLKTILWILMLTNTRQASGSGNPVIRIATSPLAGTVEPVEYNESGVPVKFKGVAFDYAYWLTKRSHLTPVVSSVRYQSKPGSVPGELRNGTWTGMIGDLTINLVDWVLYPLGAKLVYIPYAEQTFPYADASFDLYIPYPESTISIWAIVKPFDLTTWLLSAASFVSASFVLSFVSQWILGKKQSSYGTAALYLFAVLTGQGGYWDHKGKTNYFLTTTWCIAALVIVNAYSGVLMSNLTTPLPQPLVTSLDDLAAKPYVHLNSYYGSYHTYFLKSATTGTGKILADRLQLEPQKMMQSVAECLEHVEKGPNVCIVPSMAGDKYVKRRFDETGHCLLTRLSPNVIDYQPGFLLQKNSSFYNMINIGILWARAYGLDEIWTKNNMEMNVPCMFQSSKPRAKLQKLSLENFAGAFLLLFIGLSLAAFSLLTEKILFRIQE